MMGKLHTAASGGSRGLKAVLLRKLGLPSAEWLRENLRLDPFDFLSALEYGRINENTEEALALMRNNPDAFITTAADYAAAGFYREAVETLRLCNDASPMLKYHEAAYLFSEGAGTARETALREASVRNVEYCFPNRLEDIYALEFACGKNSIDSAAPYLLGSLYYDKKQYEPAISLWERSAATGPWFPTVHRNLALAYFKAHFF